MKRSSLLLTQAILASFLFGLVVSIIVVWGVGIRQVWEAFTHAKLWVIAGYVAVSLLILLFLTIKWRVVLDAYKVRMPFASLFIYRMIGFAVGYVSPTAHVGGEPVRALLLKKDGVPMNVAFSSAIADRSLELLVHVGVFFFGALLILNTVSFPLVARVSIFILSIIAVAIATLFIYLVFGKKRILVPALKFFRLNKLRNWERLQGEADELEDLLEYFYAHKQEHFQKAMLLNAIIWLLMFLEYKFALLILGYDAPVYAIFLFLTGVGIAYSIPIPGALGVLELGQVSAGALLGVGGAIGVALAFLIRIRDLLWTIIGFGLLGLQHLNFFNLHERSKRAARKYQFETLDLELSLLRRRSRR